MKKYKHGIAVMRLQPLHNGHKRLIERMQKECQNVTVLIGSAQEQRTEKNPFSFFERSTMLKNVFPYGVSVLAIKDIGRPDLWAEYVIGKVVCRFSYLPIPDVYYAGSSSDLELFKDSIKTIDVQRKDFVGTEIRDMIYKGIDAWKDNVPGINHFIIEDYINVI